MPELLGTTDAALVLRCSPENVRALVRAGKLRARRTRSGRHVFESDAVERLAREREEYKQSRAASTNN